MSIAGAVAIGRCAQHAARRLDRPRAEQRDAARRIAAGFDLAAVGVPDPHPHVGDIGGLQQDHLVAADAGAPVGDRPRPRRVHRHRALAGVEDGEVVAEAVHLAEAGHCVGDLGAGAGPSPPRAPVAG